MYEHIIGDFEPDKRRLMRSLMQPGGTVIDIGVNKGDYALLAASIVGPSGKVIAIEPAPDNCQWIREA